MNFSGKQYPKEIILMVIRWYIAYPLSYRHVEELVKERGIELDHSTVQRWVAEYGDSLLHKVQRTNKYNFSDSWRLDETYLRIKGKWMFLYRIVDKYGNTLDIYLSKYRDAFAALKCLKKALSKFNKPRKINSDGSNANECAVKIINQYLITKGEEPIHYTKVKYCNNIIEQDHRRIKRLTNPMLGFKSFSSAVSTINAYEAYAMLRKNQSSLSNINGRVLSTAEQYYEIAA